MDAVLRSVLDAARAAWPGISVADAEFVAYAAERVDPGTAPHVDLYLACACSRNDPIAIAALERVLFPELDAALAHLDRTGTLRDEVKQVLRSKLFVASAGSPARVLEYRGRSGLGGWLRVAAMRTALNLLRRDRRETSLDDEHLPDAIDDLELGFLKKTYRAEFREAFGEAFAALTRRQRTILRLLALDGLTVTHVAEILRVHRTTASRWTTEARETLARETRERMRARLKIDSAELESILRLIDSRFDVSLRAFLSQTGE